MDAAGEEAALADLLIVVEKAIALFISCYAWKLKAKGRNYAKREAYKGLALVLQRRADAARKYAFFHEASLTY